MKIPTFPIVRFAITALALAALTPACQRSGTRASAPDSAAVARDDSLAARGIVLAFGERLKQVPLLAPDSIVERTMQAQYGGLVAPMLLRTWMAHPHQAPGRRTSSPWPDRIEIATISRKSPRVFLVDGEILLRTSADSTGAAAKVPVRLAIWKAGPQWLIMNYDEGPEQPGGLATALPENDPSLSPARAAALVRAYYDAIRAKKFQDAYLMWEADGSASGQSMMEFLNGYAQLKAIDVSIGAPGPLGAAAGSRYVEVPVKVVTVDHRGTREQLAGTYTLRRSVVDGATPAQRAWHIYSANLKKQPSA